MASSATPPPFRKVLDERISTLSREIDALAGSYAADAAGRARRDVTDQLNQLVRRMRQANSASDLAVALLDATGGFVEYAALFRVSGATVAGESVRGVSGDCAAAFRSLEIPLIEAPALAAAVETLDPVVCARFAAEISAGLVALTGGVPEDRIYVFPVAPQDAAVALLCAWGRADAPALEMLAQLAGAYLGRIAGSATELIAISPAQPDAAQPSSWDALSSEARRVHLRAQRFARVRVSEILLKHRSALRAGRSLRGVYEAVREPIDEAREEFRASYMGPCPSMVDYLHLELVRILADDDAELLGKNYPGVLV